MRTDTQSDYTLSGFQDFFNLSSRIGSISQVFNDKFYFKYHVNQITIEGVDGTKIMLSTEIPMTLNST